MHIEITHHKSNKTMHAESYMAEKKHHINTINEPQGYSTM